ncbi:Zinc finger protein [Plecturocebus cupreus]
MSNLARRGGSAILAPWEAEAGRSRGQEFETSLANMVRVIENSKLTKQQQSRERSYNINNEEWGKIRMKHGTFTDSKRKSNIDNDRWGLTLSPRLKCSGAITADCSLELLGSSNSSTLASQVARTTGMCHQAWLIFKYFVERGSRFTAHADFQLVLGL